MVKLKYWLGRETTLRVGDNILPGRVISLPVINPTEGGFGRDCSGLSSNYAFELEGSDDLAPLRITNGKQAKYDKVHAEKDEDGKYRLSLDTDTILDKLLLFGGHSLRRIVA